MRTWRFLRMMLWPPKPPTCVRKMINFTRPRKGHWADFKGGTNFDAQFIICGNVAKGDEIFVSMQSGRIGCYSLFSVLQNFSGVGEWKARGCLVRLYENARPLSCFDPQPRRRIAGLLGDGSGRVQPDSGKLAPLSSGFTEPTSEFWKIFVRDEACRNRADSLRTAGNLRLG